MTFDELKKNKPTTSWVEYDEDGEFFTEENSSATNKVLDTYINNLQQLGENPTEVEVMQVVKIAISCFSYSIYPLLKKIYNITINLF